MAILHSQYQALQTSSSIRGIDRRPFMGGLAAIQFEYRIIGQFVAQAKARGIGRRRSGLCHFLVSARHQPLPALHLHVFFHDHVRGLLHLRCFGCPQNHGGKRLFLGWIPQVERKLFLQVFPLVHRTDLQILFSPCCKRRRGHVADLLRTAV